MKKNFLIFYNKIIFFLDNAQRKSTLNLIFLMFLSTVAELFSISLIIIILNFFLVSDSINNIYLPFYGDFNFFSNVSRDYLLVVLIIFLIISFIFKSLILLYCSWEESKFYAILKKNISNNLFYNFLYRNPLKLLQSNSSVHLRNFTSEIDLTTVFFNSLLKIILDLIIVFLLFIFLIFFNPLISLFVFIIFFIGSNFYYLYLKNKILEWGKKRIYIQKKKIQFISESFSAIKYIKILSRENFFFQKFKSQNYNLFNITHKIFFIGSVPRQFFEFLVFITIIILVLILFKNNYSNNEIIKILSVYVIISFRLIPSANRILGNLQTLRFGYPAFNKIYCELQISTESEINILNKFNFKKNIIIKISKFFYNKNDKFNLNNININIVKNTKIGIIGPSGSGKSTLINIICGFIKCHNGGVKVDNESIFKNLKNWQKNIGYVPQNIIILNDTFRNNILFGLHPKLFSDKSILKVLQIANLYNFYKKLPNGLNQIIKQDGINISGGEIQRIGIARALISNPKLIILDESTSALDSFTENQILKEIGIIKKTIIFVSHRLNSLEFCDKIYRVSNGKVLLFRKNKNFVKFNNK